MHWLLDAVWYGICIGAWVYLIGNVYQWLFTRVKREK